MALLSPGVEVKEIDLSIIVPKISAVVAGFAGVFEKGPIGIPVLITSVAEFISYFGKPSDTNYNDWYQVYSFLQYANKIYVSRAIASSGALNSMVEVAVAGQNNPSLNPTDDSDNYSLIENSEVYEMVESSIVSDASTAIKFIAKDAGEYGSKIEIAIAKTLDFSTGLTQIFPGINLNEQFERVPTSSEIAIAIRVDDIIVETYIVSIIPGTKDYQNKSVFAEDVLNRKSNYVYCKVITGAGLPNSCLNSNTVSLSGGTSGTIDVGDLTTAYGSYSDGTIFGNKESLDIDLLIANELVRSEVGDLAYQRADCIAFVGPKYEDVVGLKSSTAVSNMITDVNGFSGGLTTSYAAYFGNYLYIYDTYNDKYRWISPAGISAGLRADTTSKRAEWYASAGLDNGRVLLAQKIAFVPSQGQRDILYKSKINPIAQFPGNGIVIYGQKTLQSKASASKNINNIKVGELLYYGIKTINNKSYTGFYREENIS